MPPAGHSEEGEPVTWDESKVRRDDEGQFAEKAGGNASFLAKFSRKIGATAKVEMRKQLPRRRRK